MESQYDEFGNYIGPQLSSDSEGDIPEALQGSAATAAKEADNDILLEGANLAEEFETSLAIAEHYPSASEVYGETVETLVGDVDTQPLSEPIVAAVVEKKFDKVFSAPLETDLDWRFVQESAKASPDNLRNVCFLGNLHHGKTLLTDIFVEKTHSEGRWNIAETGRGFLDYRSDERERLLSIKTTPFVTALEDPNGKNWILNLMDTPGHPNFIDECIAAMTASDVAVIVVDVLCGVERNTTNLIKEAMTQGLTMVLVLNCMDRLILELKLPPTDAYHKIRYVLEEVNTVVTEMNEQLGRSCRSFAPTAGNVAFASGKCSFIFTLASMARRYASSFAEVNATAMNPRRGVRALQGIDATELSRRLWGDVYFNRETRRFQRESVDASGDPMRRSFVEFILEPLWKLFSACVAEEKPVVEAVLDELGVSLKAASYQLATGDLLHTACKALFADSTETLVEMVVEHGDSPLTHALAKLRTHYSGALNVKSDFGRGLMTLDRSGFLVAHSVKNYHRPDCKQFDCLVRVYSGTIKIHDTIRVLGAKYTPANPEDSVTRIVTDLWLFNGRYRIPIMEAYPGQVVLVGGIDETIVKMATLVGLEVPNGEKAPDAEVFRTPTFEGISGSVKISCEPLKPSELPSMVRGLRCLERAYPLLRTKVEDSGEHVLCGSGELMMDCALHDLRLLYGDLEVKVADPVVALQETVIEESVAIAFAQTPNGKNKISCVASPMEDDLCKAIQERRLPQEELLDPIARAAMLQKQFGYNEMDAKSVWTFGPNLVSESAGTCLLADETIPTAGSPVLKSEVKDYLMQGFQWISREGPLIEEPVRQTKFRLIDLELADEPMHRGGGQLVPSSRRAFYSAFLLATPRLMEPILFAEITCSANAVHGVFDVLTRRRGYVVKDQPKPGTPLFEVHAYIPAMDSFGFETDIRTHASGQAMVLQFFDHWSVVPGDPLDRSILLRPLEPAPAPHLARECTLKTRRRKGLTDDVQMAGVTWEGM